MARPIHRPVWEAACVAVLLFLATSCGGKKGADPESAAALPGSTAPLPDLSGLAWIEEDAFLAVHDAKVPEEAGLPRVSVVTLPPPGGSLLWTPLAVKWPSTSGPSHDLESIARLPGTPTYLLTESGDGASSYRRIFVTRLSSHGTLAVHEVAEWPVPIVDVEGTAVARLEDQFYFVFAERAHGAPSTRISWARMTLAPLSFGEVEQVEFVNPMRDLVGTRPVSALEVDDHGRVWIASAYDPDQDGGPFRSEVWEVGRFGRDSSGEGRVSLFESPLRVAVLDGLKAEGLASRRSQGGVELVVGTDDEDFGGVLRRLPAGELVSGRP